MARVSREDWLDAGLAALAQDGPEALAAERLAAQLGVTRGSFYHHFASRDAFVEALLQRWATQHTQQVIEASQAAGPVGQRLDRLLATVLALPHAVGTAIRAWAAREPIVRRFQKAVDAQRMAYLAQLFRARGLQPAAAARLAELAYLMFVGLQHVYARPQPALARTLFAEIERLVRLQARPKPAGPAGRRARSEVPKR
jgi:AcrR family transcriptional regulator